MKAIQVPEPHKIHMVDLPMPNDIGSNDVRIKVRAVGICGSDIGIWLGKNPFAVYPRIPGHEVAGEIDSVGASVATLKVGDMVVIEPFLSCGTCYACKKNRPNVCENLQVFGVHRDGGYCEYLIVPAANCHKVPASLPVEVAPLIEPYTIAAQSVSRAGVERGDFVLIHGAGPIGLVIADTASRIGAHVIISEINEHRLGLSESFGASYFINPTKQSVAEEVMKITSGMGPNIIFEGTGVPELFTQAVELASTCGRIVPLAFNTEPIAVNVSLINKKELAIIGTRLEAHKFPQVIKEFEHNLDRVNTLLSGVFDVSDYQLAFDSFVAADSKHSKIVLTF
jgi:L-gulonate 5-dehydrogenase